MDFLVEHFTALLIVGAIASVGVAQLHRGAGSLIGLAMWTLVGLVGAEAYVRGGAIGLAGFPFPRPLFLAVVGALLAINVLGFVAWRRTLRGRGARVED